MARELNFKIGDTDVSYARGTTRGADPTTYHSFVLVKPDDKQATVDEFYGSYELNFSSRHGGKKVQALVGADEEEVSNALKLMGFPALGELYDKVEAEEESYEEDPMGSLSQYESASELVQHLLGEGGDWARGERDSLLKTAARVAVNLSSYHAVADQPDSLYSLYSSDKTLDVARVLMSGDTGVFNKHNSKVRVGTYVRDGGIGWGVTICQSPPSGLLLWANFNRHKQENWDDIPPLRVHSTAAEVTSYLRGILDHFKIKPDSLAEAEQASLLKLAASASVHFQDYEALTFTSDHERVNAIDQVIIRFDKAVDKKGREARLWVSGQNYTEPVSPGWGYILRVDMGMSERPCVGSNIPDVKTEVRYKRVAVPSIPLDSTVPQLVKFIRDIVRKYGLRPGTPSEAVAEDEKRSLMKTCARAALDLHAYTPTVIPRERKSSLVGGGMEVLQLDAFAEDGTPAKIYIRGEGPPNAWTYIVRKLNAGGSLIGRNCPQSTNPAEQPSYQGAVVDPIPLDSTVAQLVKYAQDIVHAYSLTPASPPEAAPVTEGIDLAGNNGEDKSLFFSRWGALLALAWQGGWVPEGTTVEGIPDWDPMNYSSNDGQLVSAKDAEEMAKALEKVLPSIPPVDVIHDFQRAAYNLDAPRIGPREEWSGEEKIQQLEQVINFIKTSGGFRVN